MRDDEKSKSELLEELKVLRAKTGGQPLIEAMERCNHIMEAMPVAVVILDMEGRIRQVNSEFEKGSGWRREEAVGRTGAELGIVEDEEGRRVEEETAPRLMREGSVANVETTIIRKDGTSFPALASYTLMRDDDGKPAGVVIVARDITDFSRAQEELHQSAEKWRSLVTNAPDVIIIVGQDGSIEFINHTVRGMTREEVIGKSVYDYLPQEYHKTQRESLRRVFDTGENDTYELAGSGPDGSVRWYSSSIGPIKSEGQVVAAVIISTDITERKKARETLEKSEKELREIFENTAMGVYRTTPDGRILMANPALVRMLGYSSFDELSRRNLEAEGYEPDYSRSVFLERIEKYGRVVGLESTWTRLDGSRLVVIENARAVRGPDGKTVYYEGTVEDITERKRMEEALRSSEERFRMIAETSPDYIVHVKGDGTLLYCSPAIGSILGYTPEERTGTSFSEVIVPSELPNAKAAFGRVMQGEVIRNFEITLLHKSGRLVIAEVNAVPVYEDGQVTSLLGTIRDITERKKAEQKLILSRAVTDSINEALILFDADGAVSFVNPEYERITGYKSSEIIGESGVEVAEKTVRHDELERVLSAFGRALEGENLKPLSTVLVNKDGKETPIEFVTSFVKDEKGKPTQIIVAISDITERKRAEEAYRTLVDRSLQGLAIFQDGRVVFVNQAMADITGYTVEEILAMSPEQVQAFVHPEDRELVWSRYRDRLEGKAVPSRYEIRGIRKDGSICFLEIYGSRTEYQGRPAIQTTYVDITEGRKARQRDEIILKTCIDGFWLIDTDGKMLEVNDAYCRMSGYSRSELLTMNLQDVEASETPQEIKQHIRKVIDKGAHRFESRHKRKDGTMMDLDISAHYLELEGGRIFTFFRDITERRRMEEALTESEAKLRYLFDNIPDFIITVDGDHRITMVNRGVAGVTVEQATGNKVYDYVHPAHHGIMRRSIERVFKSGKTAKYEVLGTGQEGPNTAWYESRVFANKIEGRVDSVTLISRDITERREMEQSLRESEERLRVALSAAEMGTWRWDPVTNQDTRGASFNGILGLEAVESTQTVEDFLEFVHPEDRDATAEEIGRAIRERDRYLAEFRIIRPDGTVRWLRDQGGPIFDENGRVSCLTGAVVDITERKLMEEAMRKSEETANAFFNAITDTTALLDTDSTFLAINKAGAARLGKDIDDIVGRKAKDFFPPEVFEVRSSMAAKVVRLGKTVRYEDERDGRHFDTCICPAFDEEGKVDRLAVYARDITEQKKAEEELTVYRGNVDHAHRLAMLGTVSASVAHQLSTPLMVLGFSLEGAMADLQKVSECSGIGEQLEDCLAAMSQVNSLVDRFRDLAGKSSEKTIGKVDVKTTAERIVRLLDKSARKAKISVHLEGLAGLPAIYFSERDVEQVFFSLVQNAIQAADGKKERQLKISGVVKDEHIELQFSDNCGGIVRRNLDKIFEPFFTTKYAGEGMGLGLSIVRRIATEAGGRVRVKSKAGKGTTFFIELPISVSRS